jgi:tetratricopeptide (TPR) repeat protein
MIDRLTKQLIEYTHNTEDPEINFKIALTYDSMNQVASAISHYIRCAERSNDKLLQYECMIRAGLAIRRQGSRLYTEKSFFQNAISILPNRPEAYLFIADVFYKLSMHHNSYMMICIGEQYCNVNEKLREPISYKGDLEFKLKKLLFAHKCGIKAEDDSFQFIKDLDIKL